MMFKNVVEKDKEMSVSAAQLRALQVENNRLLLQSIQETARFYDENRSKIMEQTLPNLTQAVNDTVPLTPQAREIYVDICLRIHKMVNDALKKWIANSDHKTAPLANFAKLTSAGNRLDILTTD
jgi:hypothetical protein